MYRNNEFRLSAEDSFNNTRALFFIGIPCGSRMRGGGKGKGGSSGKGGGGKGSATIGGLVSTNAGGTQVLRHGTMRAQVLGIEAVTADGQVYDGLTALKKDNRGFDLKQLLIGSEGTLGIVTAANLKLAPAIGDRMVIWGGLQSISAARELLVKFQGNIFR